MSIRNLFPTTIRIVHALTGRFARRACLVILALLLIVSAMARISTYLLTRQMEAVIAGLGKLQIDKTSEEQLVRTVPRLTRAKWDGQVNRTPETGDVDLGFRSGYSVVVTNEPSWLKLSNHIRPFVTCCIDSRLTKDGYEKNWILSLTDALGWRYVYFAASVTLLDGKVSRISYGVADRLGFPRPVFEIVSVTSAHSFWKSHHGAFGVQSTDDQSPQFRVDGSEHGLRVSYAYDAPIDLAAHAFQMDLSCFWGLRGCKHARQIAPALWQDKDAIEAATLARLQSLEPCPSRIVAGRTRYLPDTGITLAESEGFKHVPVNVEGGKGEETVTDFKPIEVLRPPPVGSLTAVHGRTFVPFPGDYSKRLPNFGPQWTTSGSRILFFSNMNFDSCQMVSATPEAVAAARNTSSAPRREEDRTGDSLQ